MRFGFIAHPTSIGLKRHVKMLDMLERTSRDLQDGYSRRLWSRRNLVPFIDFGRISSAAGAECGGFVQYLPLTAEEMLHDPKAILRRVLDGIDAMASEGADLVGLGGFTSIIGRRGVETADRAKVPVTSGNSLTTSAAFSALCQIWDWMRLKPEQLRIVIVGYPGSICLALARMVLEMGVAVDLVHRPGGIRSELLDHLPRAWHPRVRLTDDIGSCYADNRFFVAAPSSGGVLDADRLLTGSVGVAVWPKPGFRPGRGGPRRSRSGATCRPTK
ncbi:MAG: hypothetical protein F8N15_02230 [Methanobacterium sp.]|nr:hypothetical protein [Methanobacterium sp.]